MQSTCNLINLLKSIKTISELKSPDLILIASDGKKILTHSTIFGVLSPWLGRILQDHTGVEDVVSINVPFSGDACKELVNVLQSSEPNSAFQVSMDAATFFEIVQESFQNKGDVEICGEDQDLKEENGENVESNEETIRENENIQNKQ